MMYMSPGYPLSSPAALPPTVPLPLEGNTDHIFDMLCDLQKQLKDIELAEKMKADLQRLEASIEQADKSIREEFKASTSSTFRFHASQLLKGHCVPTLPQMILQRRFRALAPICYCVIQAVRGRTAAANDARAELTGLLWAKINVSHPQTSYSPLPTHLIC